MHIEDVLRAMLDARQESPKKVSLGLGYSEKYISRMVSGRVKLGSETLARIANYLDYALVLQDCRDDSGNSDIIIEP